MAFDAQAFLINKKKIKTKICSDIRFSIFFRRIKINRIIDRNI